MAARATRRIWLSGFLLPLVPLAFAAVNYGLAGGALLALYLAVLFQTFGGSASSADAAPRTPFGAGFRFSDPERSRWKSAVLVAGVQLAALGGGSFVLAKATSAVVDGALAFLGVLVGMPQMLWALQMVWRPWVRRHPDGVLNTAIFLPFGVGILVGILVAVA